MTRHKTLRNKLIKRLFVAYCKELKLTDIKLSIISDRLDDSSYCQWGGQCVILNLSGVINRSNEGYPINNYYTDRGNKINKFVLHNKHNTIRFIIIHELQHSIDIKHNDMEHRYYDDKGYWEVKADNKAIEVLSKER